jgi:cytochrome P450
VIAIADLPKFEELLRQAVGVGGPVDYSELFLLERVRLLRYGESDVVVFRNKDILALAANAAVGAVPVDRLLSRAGIIAPNADAGLNHIRRFFENLVFVANPPSHAPKRQTIARALAPIQVNALAPIAQEIVTDLISIATGTGEIDFMAEFCERLTTRFWGRLLEMTDPEVEQVRASIHEMVPLLFFTRTPEEIDAVNRATGRYLELITVAAFRSLKRGGNVLLAAMADRYREVHPEFQSDLFGVMLAANLSEGFHTVAVAGASCVYQLLLCPQVLSALRLDPSLVPDAATEALRLWPPLSMTERLAMEDFAFADVFIPARTAIGMLWAAGNRDPEVHQNPNDFELGRKRRVEATFGGGTHICPGRYAARMQVQAIIRGLLESTVRVEMTDNPPTWNPRSSALQLSKMPVTFTHV